MPLFVTRLGQHTDLPSFCMHINSDVNLLSFEGNFVSLHIGTVLIVCHLSFALQIYNPIIIVPTFSLQTMKTPRWFAMRTEARSLRRAASDLSQCVSLCKHSNLSSLSLINVALRGGIRRPHSLSGLSQRLCSASFNCSSSSWHL